jgi:amidase
MLETTSNLWGRTLCGFNRSLTCGGSSGGEGALIGLRGSIMGIGTDIGGSIRVPCAFNGLYGIRPTSRRICYAGCVGTRKGQIAISAVIGPMTRSIRDIELICKIVTDAQPWYLDVNTIKMNWAPRPPIIRKLVVGLMISDNVVHPHPPVVRALEAAAKALREAGHEGMQRKANYVNNF